MTAVAILTILLIMPLGLDLMWWRYDRQGEGPVQVLAVLAGLSFAMLLVMIGFTMIGLGGPNTYPSPMRTSMFALPMLPLGYWLVATRKMPATGGGAVLVAMALVALFLWEPLFVPSWMRVLHLETMTVWSVIWALSAMPFVAIVVAGFKRKAT
ncbi:hypothetical protein [Croceicoccus gelatinilyticus]|uniref:hypothetical protein n=1 Tax=Croceicoccus gelatinilyticus TaxID=2835536 RepID=UPI001BCCBF23|nr:hypothetical protein [Croceicoccus gelatinilyticus]MBS7670224.1 hypothetical protein [Croceicoccus gelatinilyticus]